MQFLAPGAHRCAEALARTGDFAVGQSPVWWVDQCEAVLTGGAELMAHRMIENRGSIQAESPMV